MCAAGFFSVIESELPSFLPSSDVWRIIYPRVAASAGRPAYLRNNLTIAILSALLPPASNNDSSLPCDRRCPSCVVIQFSFSRTGIPVSQRAWGPWLSYCHGLVCFERHNRWHATQRLTLCRGLSRIGLHRGSMGKRHFSTDHSWVNELCWYFDLIPLPLMTLFLAHSVQLGTGKVSQPSLFFLPSQLEVHP
jgi:hypothetical protein